MATKEAVNSSVGLGLAIIGAVCGTVAGSLSTGPGAVRLVGLCLGAAIPPFVSTVGRWRPVRAGFAVLITVVAAMVTYSGSVGVGAATNSKIVPPPIELVEEIAGRSTETTQTSTPPAKVGLLEAMPAKLNCRPVCDSKVTIKSTGTAPAHVDTVDIDGPGKAKFTRTDECVGKTLEPGEDCSFKVTFKPAGATSTQTAQVVIRGDQDHETKVELSGTQPPPLLDLGVSSQGLSCILQPGGTADGRDELQVFFHVSLTGATPEQLPGLVPVQVTSVPGATVTVNTAVSRSSTGSTVAALPLSALDYGRGHSVTVTIDPGHKIAERSETNNVLRFRVTIPAKARAPRTAELSC
ncbi:Uncharacterised protein [Amycolatopsis camponoti]|uniref:CARDB domain-containing protein n=1 Tax=Amycolatopsis camponoti TaxID=2606593 RepID=A0A6I8LUB3_9PSEU|nr:hypothetical protein [Amycolatopsis camponoti]VVJ21624.1 Uncharacterised protein [Amycolatopsis camponoti]